MHTDSGTRMPTRVKRYHNHPQVLQQTTVGIPTNSVPVFAPLHLSRSKKMTVNPYLEQCFLCLDEIDITPSTLRSMKSFAGCRRPDCKPTGIHLCKDCQQPFLDSAQSGGTKCPGCRQAIKVVAAVEVRSHCSWLTLFFAWVWSEPSQ